MLLSLLLQSTRWFWYAINKSSRSDSLTLYEDSNRVSCKLYIRFFLISYMRIASSLLSSGFSNSFGKSMTGTFANNCIAIIRNRNIFNLFSVSIAAASLSFLLSSEGICAITALAYFCQNKSIHFPSIFSRQACSMYESASLLPSRFISFCCN